MLRAPQLASFGDLSFEFEPWSGWVRCLRWRGEEVIHAVYCAVRGEDWSTCRIESFDERRDESRIAFRSRSMDAPFWWETEITFGEDWLRYEVKGQCEANFRTARTGLCLLHPTRPRSFLVGHHDGRRDSITLPCPIQPHQPFTDVQSLEWETPHQSLVSVEFGGEIFETEDQRNWTDASLKTYCRRLIDAVPYTLSPGQHVHQSVMIRCQGGGGATPLFKEASFPCPEISFSAKSQEELSLCQNSGMTAVAIADANLIGPAEEAGVTLDCLFSPGALELQPPRTERGSRIWIPYHSWSSDSAKALDDLAHARSLGWTIGAFTPNNFTELNRSHPDMALVDAIGYGACPQVHAFDERSILENAWALGETYTSARIISQGRTALPLVRFSNTSDSRITDGLPFAYRLLALASLAEAGCSRVVFTDAAGTEPDSDAMRDLWEIIRLRPTHVEVARRGQQTRLQFTKGSSSLTFTVNASAETADGQAPYSVRREL